MLIRALEPHSGIEAMAERRGIADAGHLCAGTGRFTQAIGVNIALNGAALGQPPFCLEKRHRAVEMVSGRRIALHKVPKRLGVSD